MQTEIKSYTKDELLQIFTKEPPTDFFAGLVRDVFQDAASCNPFDYLDEDYQIAADPPDGRAVYYSAIWENSNSFVISVGYGTSVDPGSLKDPCGNKKENLLLHLGEFKDRTGQNAICPSGTDYDRLEIYIRKAWQEESYSITLADIFRSKVYPNQDDKDKEQLVGLAGFLMRQIKAGKVIDLPAMKAEVDMLDPASRNNHALVLNAYLASDKVREWIDTDRLRHGKKPLLQALLKGDILDMKEVRYPEPVLN